MADNGSKVFGVLLVALREHSEFRIHAMLSCVKKCDIVDTALNMYVDGKDNFDVINNTDNLDIINKYLSESGYNLTAHPILQQTEHKVDIVQLLRSQYGDMLTIN